MPITTASFSVAQTLGAPSIMVVTDTSTGSDSNVTSRRIYIRKSDGTYLVPSGTTTQYVVWPIADSNISLNILASDMALYITVQWLDSGDNVLYTSANTYVFTQYSELFYYMLTQQLASNYTIIQDNDYYSNKLLLRVEIDSANQAVSIGNDILASQSCLERAAFIIANQAKYF